MADERESRNKRDQAETVTLRGAVRVFLRYPTPWILGVSALAALAVRLWLGAFTYWDLVIPAAILALWPTQEWVFHVVFLHFRPRRLLGRTLDLPVARAHRAHHRDPWRIDKAFIPLHIVIGGVPFQLLIWNVLLPPTLAFTGIAFYLLLATHYEWIHFIVHTRYKPRGAWLRRLWHSHRLHHCKNERYWYGVTMLSGDRLLGTSPAPQATPLSPTCRTLGYEGDLGAGREVPA
ncbi:MAG: putative fatty acid hydroxylase [Myxococcales bacterium]